METITSFIEANIDLKLLFIIVLGGIFITKYTKAITKPNNQYKVLIASVLVSAIFYFIEECQTECLSKYFFTYLFATSFYELIVKTLMEKVKIWTSK